MDYKLLSRVVEELSGLITTARVERVYQTPDSALVLVLARGGKKFNLLISPDRSLPRLHLVSVKPPVGDAPQTFTLYLRSHLPGSRISRISLLNNDRIVDIHLAKSDRGFRLIAELFGPAANLIFTDNSSTILSAHHPIPPAEGSSRAIFQGLLYHTPEKKPGTERCVENASLSDAESILSPNEAAEQYYDRLVEHRREQSLRTELRAVMKTAYARSGRLRESLSRELQSAERAEEYRRAGDLVLANLNNLRTGMDRAVLAGYEGAATEVLLDPKRTPALNAERYFKLYKKAKAGRDIILTRLKHVDDDAEFLRSCLTQLDSAEGLDELAAIRSELAGRRLFGKRKGGQGVSHSGSGSAPVPFRKVLYREWEILIGKSAAGNDYLTMKLARPDDLWFHAEGLPGSHVLVRNPRNRDVPPDVLLKAASLAAFYSKGKESSKVSVTYTRAGLVRKPKGAKPGLVTLSERRSLMVKPEDA
jgi:predicted ribosome quality control (RQC) complex YloA/Tae2 family protein